MKNFQQIVSSLFTTSYFLGWQLFFIVWLSAIFTSHAQDDSTYLTRPNYIHTGGLVAYYFWEEDSLGNILPGKLEKPYLQNFVVVQNTKLRLPKKNPTRKELQKLIASFCHDVKPHHHSVYTLEDAKKKKKFGFPLARYTADLRTSVVYRLKNNKWNCEKLGTVHYFNISATGKGSYSHSSDSVILFHPVKTAVRSNGHYMVYTYYRADGSKEYQRVVNYSGNDVSEEFAPNAKTAPKRLLVFANGYRGPNKEKDLSDNLVTMRDRYGYWFKLDNRFIERLQPDASFYIDGSFSVKTSNHRNSLNFGISLFRAHITPLNARNYRKLNTRSNPDGFLERRAAGKIAGLAFLYAKCASPECDNVKDTIDIVCHSMGYAYTLGFLETIKDRVVFGRLYILAPENASFEGFDWSLFEEVWQYGSNLDQPTPDPLKHQDGVAPQTAVKGIETVPAANGGRVFIPEKWPNKQFVHSHMVYSYDWMFDWILKGERGYVGR